MNARYDNDRSELIDYLVTESQAPVNAAACALGERVRSFYGECVVAVLYYGSCFRSGTVVDGILDIFIIVDDYRSAYAKKIPAFANQLLPPNVYYYEMDFKGETLRTKYAVISLKQFNHRTSARCFHTFFWARFAQPCALMFTRDESSRRELAGALAGAIDTFVANTAPVLPPVFDASDLWTTGLSASYKTELRPEQPGSAARLVEKNKARYDRVTQLLAESRDDLTVVEAGELKFRHRASTARQWRLKQIWRVRRFQGKAINLARIMKAAFTFDGGVDYVLWKIERHSGVKVEASPFMRRHPLLACWPTVWRLYRAGAFR